MGREIHPLPLNMREEIVSSELWQNSLHSKSQVSFVPASACLSKVEQRAAEGNDEKLCLI